MHKSISPIVSMTLLLILTIVSAVSAFFFITAIMEDSQSGFDTSLNPLSDHSNIKIVSALGDSVILLNEGSGPAYELLIFINDELLDYELEEPLFPGEGVEVTFFPRKAGEDFTVKVVYGTGKQVETFSPAERNTVERRFVANPVSLNSKPNLIESDCYEYNASYVWFNGIVSGTGGACCGYGGLLDNFYNSSIGSTQHFCYQGVYVFQPIDYNKNLCEAQGYSWINHGVVEDFITFEENETIRNKNGWDAWTEAADCSFTRYIDGGGRSWGRFADANATANINPVFTFSASRDWVAGDWFSLETSHAVLDAARISIGAAATLEYSSAGIYLLNPPSTYIESFENDNNSNVVADGTNLYTAGTQFEHITLRGYVNFPTYGTLYKRISGDAHYIEFKDIRTDGSAGVQFEWTGNSINYEAGKYIEFDARIPSHAASGGFTVGSYSSSPPWYRYSYIVMAVNSTGAMRVYNGAAYVGTDYTGMSENTWYHYKMEFDASSTFKLWINGVPVKIASNGNDPMCYQAIGSGNIDHLSVSSSTATLDQIHIKNLTVSWIEADANIELFNSTDGELKVQAINASSVNFFLDGVPSTANPVSLAMGTVSNVELDSGNGTFDITDIRASWINSPIGFMQGSAACCGDDGALDVFGNSTHSCCNGVFTVGSCP
ncbi:MAG: hypothetical protein PHS81_03660 [Candidatus Nanoarchaeia archaeon]|nr:hypothetical protein [Candidatus Nanoarchaeia archaeon]